MIKNLLYLSFIFLILLGCKSKSKRLAPSDNIPGLQKITLQKDSSQINLQKFISRVDSNDFQFNTFSARGQINFDQNGENHSADIQIRIKRDEIIWFYVNYSIVAVAQGYITPTDIKFKNLLKGDYVHKDFKYLQEIAGIPIQFRDLQALLVGNKLQTFIGDSTRVNVNSSGELLLEGIRQSIKNRFFFNSQFRTTLVELEDSVNKRKVNLKYGNFLGQNGTFIPQSIWIQAEAPENKLEIQMDYRKFQINPEQDYPFHSPDGSN